MITFSYALVLIAMAWKGQVITLDHLEPILITAMADIALVLIVTTAVTGGGG